MAINQSFFRRALIIILLSFCVSNVFSQQKSNYSLLWKITGKGLKKPSYLFGTMHVKDRRVFNFSDSVMLALQSCPQFALEVHPDTVMIKMFAMLQNQDTLRSLDKMLSKEQYDRLAKKFKEKNGYSMDKVDPMVLESLMQPDDDKPDDQVSFIDAYLYGIARTLNKGIFGLETAESQIGLYDSGDAIKERILDLIDDDALAGRAEGMDEMVKVYSTGDLDLIYKYASESGMLDSVITARNKVMASSMIKYMADSALFTAVGAAHLPGPNGVIALLRNAGYQVTKVHASFTGVADKYHIDYMKMNWPEHRDEESGYSINFPGTPIQNTVYGLNNIVYPDLANGLYYGLSSTPRGTQGKPAAWAAVVAQTIKNLHSNKKNVILNRKDFVFNKLPCTELLLKNGSGYMRMRLILANNQLFSIYTGSKTNHLHQAYTDRYLNSFKSFPIAEKVAKPWITFTDTVGAFTVKLPVKPKPITKEIPSKIQKKDVFFTMNMFLSTDTITSKSYLVRYNDYPPGTYLNDKQAVFENLINDFKEKGKVLSGPVKIWKDGYEGREIKVLLNDVYNTDIRLYIRGNRMYVLLKEIIQADMKDDNVQDPFFDSFHLTPVAEPVYYAYQPDNAGFKVKTVAKPEVLPDTEKTYNDYLQNNVASFSTDPNSGGLYDFESSKISPYYRIENVDSLYKTLIKRFTGYRDSIIKVDTVAVSGVKGRELLLVTRLTGVKKRMRIVVDDDNLFYFMAKVDSSALFNKTSDTFYNSLQITSAATKKIDLASSKAEKICSDLASTDTNTYQRALGALSFYKFKTNELPYLYQALKRNYPDDTLVKGARCMMLKQLETVNNDSTSNFLVRLYADLNGKDEVKASVLQALPNIDKKNGYDIYFKLFTTTTPLKIKDVYRVFNPIIDSTEFGGDHFEQLLPFLKNDKYRDHILRIATSISILKNDSYAKKLKDNYKALTAYAISDLDNYINLKDSTNNDWSYYIYNYLQLMNKVHNEDINDKFTKHYLEKIPNGTYAVEAVVARINNNLPNKQQLVNKFIDSIGSRYDMMQAYADQKQLSRVPPKYKTQDAFAKLCLYQEVSSDDYGSPEKMALLGNIVKNGSVYYVFKYSLQEREETKQLIGIVGPYKPGATKLNFEKYNAYTDYDILKTNWRAQATKMIKPLLEQYK